MMRIRIVGFANCNCEANPLEGGDGTCCKELNSICNIGGGDHEGYYAKLDGGSCY